jgi:hypothetical protein
MGISPQDYEKPGAVPGYGNDYRDLARTVMYRACGENGNRILPFF